MLELEERKQKIHKNFISPELQSTDAGSMDVLGDDSFTSVGSKRKRVIVSSCGRDCCVFDVK